MTESFDVRALARLARLGITDAEAEALTREIPAILDFVKTIEAAPTDAADAEVARGTMRDDADPHESGIYTDALLNAAPAVRGGKIAVRQVVSRKRDGER